MYTLTLSLSLAASPIRTFLSLVSVYMCVCLSGCLCVIASLSTLPINKHGHDVLLDVVDRKA